MKEDEYPIFSDIVEQPNIFTIVERKLNNYSADYIIQIWEAGLITIPSIPVSIKRYNQDILYLHSGVIKISTLSNINEKNSFLKDIKPLHELEIMSYYIIILYIFLIIIAWLTII